MDFSLSEEQQELQALARQVFTGDRAVWKELAAANLLGVAVPERYGGLGYGIFELCLVLEEQGRAAVHLPVLPTLVTAMAVAASGTDDERDRWLPAVAAGDAVLTAVVDDVVPYLAEADAVWLAGGLVAGNEVEGTSVVTTSGIPNGVLARPAGDTARHGGGGRDRGLRSWWTVALCALQVGLADEALRITAEYTKGRKQFDKPLASFQAVAQRAADAYIDVQAIRLTTQQAAWRLAEGLPADDEVAIAKFWAADGGQRVVHAAQHLHGGIGVDTDYPLHRYFTWSKEIELALGGATQQLVMLGQRLAE